MRPLKLLFVQLGFHPDYPDVSTLATTYNDGIYYVASFVKDQLEGAEVEVAQMLWKEDPLARPIESYDYILISALGTQFWSNLDVLQEIVRRKRPGCRIIMGGPHASFAPQEALRHADFVIIGEGEVPAVALLRALEAGGDLDEVENLCYLTPDGNLKLNRLKRYPSLGQAIRPELLASAPRLHWATVSMSRGCPFNCSFCYAVRLLGRTFRPKDVTDIVREVDAIAAQTGCRRFYVTDLDFTTRRDFSIEVARALRGRGYRFVAMSRIEFADDGELLDELKQSGFDEYCIGVESEDPSVLQAFNKRVDASQQTQRLLSLAERDLYTHSAIIFGLDRQDLPMIQKTARWCAEARLMHPTFVCLAEYPFQKLMFASRQDIEDHRIIRAVPTYQHYSFVGIFPRHMRPSRLQLAILESYDIFFARALEIETRPQRWARLKSYERSVALGRPGMQRHIEFLEQLEQPFYRGSDDVLDEDALKQDFEERWGGERAWLERSLRRHPEFLKVFAR